MSLTGNLEDLPLLDILQIVSFSKKTGWLGITTEAGDGAIVFRDGFVVAALAFELPPLDPRFASLGPQQQEGLIRRRIEIALGRLIRLREGQFRFSLGSEPPASVGGHPLAPEILAQGINPQELLLDLARGMDEDRRDSSEALEASFGEPAAPAAAPEPADTEVAAEPAPEPAPPEPAPPEPVPARRDLAPEYTALRETLPEYTVPMQAVSEELLRASAAALPAAAVPPAPPAAAAPEPSPAVEPAPPAPEPTPPAEQAPAPPAAGAAPEPAAADEITALLLVDDEEDVRRVLAQSFTQAGYQVVEAEDPDGALKKAGRLSKAGIGFVVVTDLGMPSSGGSSFQGGFEVVKRLVKMRLAAPVLMMTETLSPAVRARAKQLGISSFVFKPSLSKLDPEQHRADLRGFAQKLIDDVLPELARRGQPPKRGPGGRDPAPSAAASAAHEGTARDLKVLQQHLAELRGSADPARIPALVMRVAREVFERGVLLLVKNEQLVGLGGFGPAGSGDNINLVVREVVIPLGEPSLFHDVVRSGRPWSGPLPEGRWSGYLMARLGRFRSDGVTLLPLVAHRDTIALLFGDNPETGRAPERIEALELFMHQAGIAMENALLQRKLRLMQEKG